MAAVFRGDLVVAFSRTIVGWHRLTLRVKLMAPNPVPLLRSFLIVAHLRIKLGYFKLAKRISFLWRRGQLKSCGVHCSKGAYLSRHGAFWRKRYRLADKLQSA
jgi:hypothetical protein